MAAPRRENRTRSFGQQDIAGALEAAASVRENLDWSRHD